MNSPFIGLTHFVTKKQFLLNVNKIVTIENEESDEGNARVCTCLNQSFYTVETVAEIEKLIDDSGKIIFYNTKNVSY